MILVTGATGNVGRELVQQLADAGQQVRALTRRAGQTTAANVEAVTGDLNQPETLTPHLGGVDGVFLLAGYQNLEQSLAAMREAGVARVVLLSSSAAPSGDLTNAVARYHILSERAVQESGLAWTFLQPNSFMSGTLQWIPQLAEGDVVRAAFPNVRVATIDPHDIAAVAAEALVSGAHDGRAYRLSGPESLFPEDRVRILGQVLKRPLRFEGLSNAQAREEMSAAMPAEYVDAFFRFFADGTLDESEVLPTVAEVTGRPPRTFEEWATAHAREFSHQGG